MKSNSMTTNCKNLKELKFSVVLHRNLGVRYSRVLELIYVYYVELEDILTNVQFTLSHNHGGQVFSVTVECHGTI